jgi:hypothetical protein
MWCGILWQCSWIFHWKVMSLYASQHRHTTGDGNFLKQTPWPLVRKRTIPTDRPPLVDEIWCQLLWIEGCRVVSAAEPLRSLCIKIYVHSLPQKGYSTDFHSVD